MIEEAGARLLFLPPRGKHFNPIECAFAKVKGFIRQSYSGSLAAKEKIHRTDRELIQAIVDGCRQITDSDLAGYFRQRAGTREFRTLYPHIALEGRN